MAATRASPRQNLELGHERTEVARDFSPPARVAGARGREARSMRPTEESPALEAAGPGALSGRAQNVLKELALELTGEQPPGGPWVPSRELLLALTAERLAAARNCGPRTLREITGWAQSQGVTIKPAFEAGRSLSDMWAGLIEKASHGALTPAETAQALQKSIRRKSMRIPVAIQTALLKMLRDSD